MYCYIILLLLFSIDTPRIHASDSAKVGPAARRC